LSKIKSNLTSTLRSLNLLEWVTRCISLSFFTRQKFLSVVFIDFQPSVILNRDWTAMTKNRKWQLYSDTSANEWPC
jgi:hypothetical protein